MNLTYRIDQAVRLVQSPVILKTENAETAYENGAALADACFGKRYAIDSVTAEEGRVVIRVSEHAEKGTADREDRNISLFDGD